MSRSVVLENLAGELRPSGTNGTGTPAELADRYLQKLINVEVALPPLTSGHGLSLMTRAQVPSPAAAEERSAVSRASGWGLAALAAFSVGWAAYQGGARLGDVVEGDAVPAGAVAVAEVGDAGKKREMASASSPGAARGEAREAKEPRYKSRVAAAAGPPAPAAVPAVPVPLPERWTIQPPSPPSKTLWSVVPWLLLVWAGLVTLALSSTPRPMTTDSREFREALERWSAVIQLRNPTPRALKRFLNRLRFWAMRLRAEREPVIPVSPWQRWLLRAPAPPARPQSMSEATLVALAAMHALRPGVVENPGQLAVVDPDRPDSERQLILAALGDVRPSEEDRIRFLQLLGTVNVGSA
ncbi:MAG TPA: hypothetical protein VND93_00410, partial [Myxococcales bacterium]|nr:hypothetical protein [Myxococcales bacterium]